MSYAGRGYSGRGRGAQNRESRPTSSLGRGSGRGGGTGPPRPTYTGPKSSTKPAAVKTLQLTSPRGGNIYHPTPGESEDRERRVRLPVVTDKHSWLYSSGDNINSHPEDTLVTAWHKRHVVRDVSDVVAGAARSTPTYFHELTSADRHFYFGDEGKELVVDPYPTYKINLEVQSDGSSWVEMYWKDGGLIDHDLAHQCEVNLLRSGRILVVADCSNQYDQSYSWSSQPWRIFSLTEITHINVADPLYYPDRLKISHLPDTPCQIWWLSGSRKIGKSPMKATLYQRMMVPLFAFNAATHAIRALSDVRPPDWQRLACTHHVDRGMILSVPEWPGIASATPDMKRLYQEGIRARFAVQDGVECWTELWRPETLIPAVQCWVESLHTWPAQRVVTWWSLVSTKPYNYDFRQVELAVEERQKRYLLENKYKVGAKQDSLYARISCTAPYEELIPPTLLVTYLSAEKRASLNKKWVKNALPPASKRERSLTPSSQQGSLKSARRGDMELDPQLKRTIFQVEELVKALSKSTGIVIPLEPPLESVEAMETDVAKVTSGTTLDASIPAVSNVHRHQDPVYHTPGMDITGLTYFEVANLVPEQRSTSGIAAERMGAVVPRPTPASLVNNHAVTLAGIDRLVPAKTDILWGTDGYTFEIPRFDLEVLPAVDPQSLSGNRELDEIWYCEGFALRRAAITVAPAWSEHPVGPHGHAAILIARVIYCARTDEVRGKVIVLPILLPVENNPTTDDCIAIRSFLLKSRWATWEPLEDNLNTLAPQGIKLAGVNIIQLYPSLTRHSMPMNPLVVKPSAPLSPFPLDVGTGLCDILRYQGIPREEYLGLANMIRLLVSQEREAPLMEQAFVQAFRRGRREPSVLMMGPLRAFLINKWLEDYPHGRPDVFTDHEANDLMAEGYICDEQGYARRPTREQHTPPRTQSDQFTLVQGSGGRSSTKSTATPTKLLGNLDLRQVPLVHESVKTANRYELITVELPEEGEVLGDPCEDGDQENSRHESGGGESHQTESPAPDELD